MTKRPDRNRLSLIAALALALGLGGCAGAADYDVLIRGGMLFDGTGAPRRPADVAIRGDRVVRVGAIPSTATAAKVVDARGRFVAPGFIDAHSHAAPDIGAPAFAAALPALYQGVTSVMINPDGMGPADIRPELAEIEKTGPGVNVIPMIGQGAVRQEVMGLAARKATPDEIARMQGLVKQAMDAGAFGLSAGPFYIPGKYSDTAEQVAVAKAVAPYPHAFYASHIRDESNYDVGVLAAIGEVVTVAREAGITGVVSHMKMLGPGVWGKSAEAVKMIDDARAQGVSVWADQYVYDASNTTLAAALVPGWAQEGGVVALSRRLQDPEQRARIRREMIPNLALRAGPHAILLLSDDPALDGRRLDELAAARGQDPVDAAIGILTGGDVRIVSFNMSEADIETIMKQPWTMTSSDSLLPRFGVGHEHPRAYGAFTRKLRRYALDRPVITLEQAIHSSSGLTARVFGIEDRGVIRPGAFADVIVFDPRTVRDVATYEKPHAYSQGMEYVFVNGRAAVWEGRATPERFGRVLLRPH
jgi:N-acyl-D-amino-acid deacylase